jgi:tetrapyrrole methylase family protein/MazG family protein
LASHQREDGSSYVEEIPLYTLDHSRKFDHTSCIYLPRLSLRELTSYKFRHLVEVMEMLRAPEGCPWDREQSHETLKQFLIEETYEVLEAIDLKDMDKLAEELGDVLLQVVFHAQIAKEHGEFSMGDVITGICRKMIDRHTHIFGDVKVDSAEQVIDNWEAIKKKEKGLKSHTQVLKDIPAILPALMRSYKIQQKAALVGFDWDKPEDAMAKAEEEFRELREAYQSGSEDAIREELGDLLFAIVNVSRFLKQQPELALAAATEKFIRRFAYIEEHAGKPLEEMTLEEMDMLWNQAKCTF